MIVDCHAHLLPAWRRAQLIEWTLAQMYRDVREFGLPPEPEDRLLGGNPLALMQRARGA